MPTNSVQIRHCESHGVAQVCDIYNHYITHTAITFEEEPLDTADMRARVDVYTKPYPWLVCCKDDAVVGHFSEVGRKFGQWLDVGYWQRPGRTPLPYL